MYVEVDCDCVIVMCDYFGCLFGVFEGGGVEVDVCGFGCESGI